MAISVTNIGVAIGGAVTSIAVTVPVGGVPANALIIVDVAEGAIVLGGSVADPVNTSYTATTAVSANGLITNGFGQMFYFPGCGALTSGQSITYTKTNATTAACMSAFYATGIDTASPLDTAVTNSATGSSSSPSVTSGTPSVTGELIHAFAMWSAGTLAGTTYTQDTTHSWVTPPVTTSTAAPRKALGGGTQVNAGTGTTVFNPTIGAPTSNPWAALIFGFKAAALTASPQRTLMGVGQ